MDTKQPTKEEIVNQAVDYVSYLKREHQLPIVSVYLFGSYVQGTPHQWSDLDLCIVSPLFANEDALMYLWRRLRREDVQKLIEPVGFTPEEFNAETPSPLVAEIRKYGKELPIT